MKKIALIDGNAILHKAFHGFPLFRTSSGEPINAVYGFSKLLLNIFNKFQPEYFAVAFDLKKKTFRHDHCTNYKANRTKAPDELYAQLPRIKELITYFKIPIYEKEGFEADDLIGSLAKISENNSLQSLIFTGDLDTLQLVNDQTRVYALVKGFSNPLIYDKNKVFSRYQISPSQIVDYKALKGDSSDNIKGVPGIGDKTAIHLLKKFQNLKSIYENLEEIKPSIATKLINGKESADLSQKLATIITDLDLEFTLENPPLENLNLEEIKEFFNLLEFKTLLKDLNRLERVHKNLIQTQQENQLSLF